MGVDLMFNPPDQGRPDLVRHDDPCRNCGEEIIYRAHQSNSYDHSMDDLYWCGTCGALTVQNTARGTLTTYTRRTPNESQTR